MKKTKDVAVPLSGRVYPETKSEIDEFIKKEKKRGIAAKDVFAEIWNVYKSSVQEKSEEDLANEEKNDIRLYMKNVEKIIFGKLDFAVEKAKLGEAAKAHAKDVVKKIN